MFINISFRSSAKTKLQQLNCGVVRSSIIVRNIRGLKLDPCGIPDVAVISVEVYIYRLLLVSC